MDKKKVFIVIGLGAISVFAAIAYVQLQKIKEYCVSLKKIKLKSFNMTNADIDVYFNFLNSSSLKLLLIRQEYFVYVNKTFVSKISNARAQEIKHNSTSVLSAKLQFSPQKVFETLKINALGLISSPRTVEVKIVSKMRIGYGILKFNITYDYITTLQELLTSEEPNSTSKKC